MTSREKAPGGLSVFILGILSISFCPLLGPVALNLGNEYQSRCLLDDLEPDPLATIGRILGIIGTVLLAIQGVFIIFWLFLTCA
jgi:hypothetical protein